MDSARSGEEDRREEVRSVVVKSLVANAVGLGLQLGLILAISKRDWLTRQALRYRRIVLQEWKGERERRLLAELQADISRIQHGDSGPAAPPRGLYEGVRGGR